MSQVQVLASKGVLCSRAFSDRLVVAALRDIRSSLPDHDFVTQLEKLKALQSRIQAVCDRLKVIEARLVLLCVVTAETKTLRPNAMLCRKEQAKYRGTCCSQHNDVDFIRAAVSAFNVACQHHSYVHLFLSYGKLGCTEHAAIENASVTAIITLQTL